MRVIDPDGAIVRPREPVRPYELEARRHDEVAARLDHQPGFPDIGVVFVQPFHRLVAAQRAPALPPYPLPGTGQLRKPERLRLQRELAASVPGVLVERG